MERSSKGATESATKTAGTKFTGVEVGKNSGAVIGEALSSEDTKRAKNYQS